MSNTKKQSTRARSIRALAAKPSSKISWTNYTFNPWIGCEEVSPGCANCYAKTLLCKRFKRVGWGPGAPRKRADPKKWADPIKWNTKAAKSTGRTYVFACSASDVFDAAVDPKWLEDLIQLIVDTPHLTWLLLTKRIENASCLPAILLKLTGKDTAANIWLGCTAEDQLHWDKRVPVLMSIPAVKHFVSAEPLIGPITPGPGAAPDWLIVGGESGPRFRRIDAGWVRTLRDWAATKSVAFHFKQWGRTGPGRTLDGRIWDQFPI